MFYFHPEPWWRFPILTIIFFSHGLVKTHQLDNETTIVRNPITQPDPTSIMESNFPSGHFWPGRGGTWQPVERLPGWRVFCGTGVVDDTIHVWCIYLLLVVFNGKIWSMQVNISYMDAMGDIYISFSNNNINILWMISIYYIYIIHLLYIYIS